jgi:hypothetical protein
MRWLCVTVGLLAASLCLLTWVYLRDRDTSSWWPPERQIVGVDTVRALATPGDAGGRTRTCDPRIMIPSL